MKQKHELFVLWEQVAQLVHMVETALGQWLMTHYNLGLTEYRAIVYVSQSQAQEVRLNDLAAYLNLNQSSVTRLVIRLEVKGLLSRDSCPNDGRGVYAKLTPVGGTLVRKAQPAYSTMLEQTIGKIAAEYSAKDAAHLSDLLVALAQYMR
ncbi:MarR family transcriptional regulator [Candidatus Saccharibacteria bacterium]|nr:MarR family transcriptional regulator [Candidatus Saccharibacteria bacterium]